MGNFHKNLCIIDVYALSNTVKPQEIREMLLTSHHTITCHVMYKNLPLISNALHQEVKYTLVQAVRLCSGRTAHKGSTDVPLRIPGKSEHFQKNKFQKLIDGSAAVVPFKWL